MMLLMTLLKCVCGMVSSSFFSTLISPLFGIKGLYMEPKAGGETRHSVVGAKSGHLIR